MFQGRRSVAIDLWVSRLGEFLRSLVRLLTLDVHFFWLAILLPLIVFCWFRQQGEISIRIAGLTFELAGLGTVAYKLFGLPKFLKQPTWKDAYDAWVARLPRWKNNVFVIADTGHLNITGFAPSIIVTRHPPSYASWDKRIAFLEQAVKELADRITKENADVVSQLIELQKAIDKLRQEFEKRSQDVESHLKEALAGNLNWERLGVWWAMLGLVLTTMSDKLAVG